MALNDNTIVTAIFCGTKYRSTTVVILTGLVTPPIPQFSSVTRRIAHEPGVAGQSASVLWGPRPWNHHIALCLGDLEWYGGCLSSAKITVLHGSGSCWVLCALCRSIEVTDRLTHFPVVIVIVYWGWMNKSMEIFHGESDCEKGIFANIEELIQRSVTVISVCKVFCFLEPFFEQFLT